MLGWAIAPGEKVIRDDIRLPFVVDLETINRLESWIYEWGGRFVFIALGDRLKRLYLDSGGTLSAVYSKERQVAGSTVSALVLDDSSHANWAKSIGEFPDQKANQFYPLSLTSDPEFRRVLPNHYLDLERWEITRHHPKFPLAAITEQDVPEAIGQMVDCLRKNITAIANTYSRVYMPLTAGRDSRMLLACSQPVRHKITYVTFDLATGNLLQRFFPSLREYRFQDGARRDLSTAKKLASGLHLSHQIMPVPMSVSESVRLDYLRRIGFAGCGSGKARSHSWSCEHHADLSGAWLTGWAGEVGRCYYWRKNDVTRKHLPKWDILKRRMKMATIPGAKEALVQWLSALPDVSAPEMLDLLYLENRLGGWASPHTYGFAPFALAAHPFCHREVFDIMMRLPPEYRLRQTLTDDIIRCAWPELGDFPFNEYFGVDAWMNLPRSTVYSFAKSTVKAMRGQRKRGEALSKSVGPSSAVRR
ncbi:MAG: hypothetical protein AAF889_04400 [Cyanobacteria bacterium P01_D01_bin.73]